ncbi:MAG: hypothetical protein A2086_12560 [Spirochaetes bacterium GWD1_27_9]|nr:MAG: hypothetical protein A2Z98_10895 [Spirochaetes bacterium GWB1_27_13]OHD23462.1 MAG: hypothetical protein A2Y34_14115 [Spirochaetes bacterium GWC1_27_15]OHD44290.1 MAG: hypothetical protein A2086_12560 [Spirochaetes bacterium GWD1_27_9]
MSLFKIYFFLIVFTVFANFLYSSTYIDVYYKQINDKQYTFFANNSNFCPYQVLVKVEVPEGMQITDSLPFYKVVPPQQNNVYLFSILTNDITKDLKFKFNFNFSMGSPDLSNDVNFEYIFPFQENEEIKLTQAYNGRYSHKGWTKYSLDFGMNVGTPICAARNGVVVAVKSDSSRGGRSYRYRYMANYIIIYHDDGSFASYMHLKKNGSLVKIGDRVNQGDLIGYSGNTGWSRGPHLHFMVYKPTVLSYQTYATLFIGENGLITELKSKTKYFSYHKKKELIVSEGTVTNNQTDTEKQETDLGGL